MILTDNDSTAPPVPPRSDITGRSSPHHRLALLELGWPWFSDGETESRRVKRPHTLVLALLSPHFRSLGFRVQLLISCGGTPPVFPPSPLTTHPLQLNLVSGPTAQLTRDQFQAARFLTCFPPAGHCPLPSHPRSGYFTCLSALKRHAPGS